MKRLMTIAAIAAIATGVYATPTYDFSATVKTTTSKYSKQTTTYTVNVGLNDTDVYWWDDLGFANDKEAKDYIKCLSDNDKAAFAYNELGFDGEKTKYNKKEQYNGKNVWCYTFKFKETTTDCYRVARSYKIKGEIEVNNCCGLAGGWQFTADSFAENGACLADPTLTIMYLTRFGGLSLAKATSIEFAAEIGDFSTVAPGNWALAGHGTYSKKLGLVNTVSGKIVGYLPAPTCSSCCGYGINAGYFICNGNDELADFANDSDSTVAYGTWAIKYNAKKSN